MKEEYIQDKCFELNVEITKGAYENCTFNQISLEKKDIGVELV